MPTWRCAPQSASSPPPAWPPTGCWWWPAWPPSCSLDSPSPGLLPEPARRRLALSAVGVTVLALIGGRVHRGRSWRRPTSGPPTSTSPSPTGNHLVPNVRVLAQGLAYLFNGDFGGARLDGRGALAFACALVLAAAAYAAVRFGRRWVTEAVARRRRAGTDRPPPVAGRARGVLVVGGRAALAGVRALQRSDRPLPSRYVLTVGYTGSPRSFPWPPPSGARGGGRWWWPACA